MEYLALSVEARGFSETCPGEPADSLPFTPFLPHFDSLNRES